MPTPEKSNSTAAPAPEKVPLVDESPAAELSALEGLGVTFIAILAAMGLLVCLLSLRDFRAGRKPFAWCPASLCPVVLR